MAPAAAQAGAQGGGSPSGALELPGCLRTLLAPCAAEGPCISEGGSPAFGTTCFDSGVSSLVTSAPDLRACSGGAAIMQVNKPDGTRCYTYESYFDASSTDCEVWRHTWKDAFGNIVATGISNPSPTWDLNITCWFTFETGP